MSSLSAEIEPLAIHGGTPVRTNLLPYGRQNVDDADIRAVVEVLKSDWLTTGPKVAEFEEQFAAWVGAQYAVSFSSGTAALHGASFAAGLGTGDEAITTPMTFCATANCVLYQGAVPVFADVSVDTLNIDPKEVSRRITSRTRAILAVDYAGHPAELTELRELAKNHGTMLIEDASHALGASYYGQRVGGIADMTTFSFHPVKHLTTGEGGMVSTNDANLAETLRRFRNNGISSQAKDRQQSGEWFYEMVLLGFNYRLSDIACVLGLSQMNKLDANVARRREIAAQYIAAFRNLPEIMIPVVRDGIDHAWHLFTIRLRLEHLTGTREEIYRALRAENIGVSVHYIPVHMHPYYQGRFQSASAPEKVYPVTEDAYERLISLPLFPVMTARDVEDVIRAVKKVITFFQEKGERPHSLQVAAAS